MKKLYLVLIALGCSFLSILALDMVMKHDLKSKVSNLIYYNTDEKNMCDYVMNQILTDDTMVVIGSSELSAVNDLTFPTALFNNGDSDYNMCLIGRGSMQSLHDAITIGALADKIPNKKVVLIVSPQWFTESHLSSETYASRFEELFFVDFLKNDSISTQTKKTIVDRVNTLLVSDPIELERVKEYESIYLNHNLNPIQHMKLLVYNSFANAKNRFMLSNNTKDMGNRSFSSKRVEADKIDYSDLLKKATDIGEERCTNNDYGIYDEYFDEYIAKKYDSFSGYYKEESYTTSAEYGDLKLFLDVCKETGITPMLISVPVNGRWYDYGQFPRSDRNTYYQNIRDIAKEYDVSMADFSDREYELYFLQDIMHIGWRGWAHLNKAVYDFYKTGEPQNTITYVGVNPNAIVYSDNSRMNSSEFVEMYTDLDGNAFNSVVVTIKEDNTIIDSTGRVGVREGLYFHDRDSGNYTVRIRANSSLQDEYIEYEMCFEKGKVYKVQYNVEELCVNSVVISNIRFFEVEY